jgi:isopentenyldiphosphate isomerase
MKTDELFPIVDESGNVAGKALRSACHGGTMLLHPVVHLHVVRPGVGLYLQQRNHDKDIQPDRWDTSVGGHVDFGEDIPSALARESREELGLDTALLHVTPMPPYIFQSDRERELINPFIAVVPDTMEPQPAPDEIQDGRFWSLDEIDASIGSGIFTPNFEQEYTRIKQSLLEIVSNAK